ncbi:MAG: protein translocase subunit SecD [Lachnospiraceae bacterium]|nr:protein translocase subunit SecD [Lachnospiraceae bacterium]
MKKSKGWIVLTVILAFLILLGYLAVGTITATGKSQGSADGSSSSEGIKLGLDLSGGVSITYRIKDENPSQEDINDTIAKLEERAETYTTEYSVYAVGGDRITVEIPGVYDANQVLEDLGSPGSLYFITQTDADGNQNYSWNSATGDYALNYDLETLTANGSVILSGDDVKSAEAAYETDQTLGTQEPVVQLQFNDDAADIFGEATTNAYASGQSIGIYYDDHFISVPTVKNAILSGDCVINNMSSFEDAQQLATFIRVGAMKLQLEELESNVVGAQLGGQALVTSLKAAIIGLALVMLFMIVMYGVSGVAASVALALYSVLVVEFIYWFEITLTLPGIAGIILGIGMAVDANVIIFARIREEIAAGKTVAVAIKEGYKKAMSAILDGQVTTFIAALVLMLLGSGTVKGFAYTLMISIILSLFTSLAIARLLMQGAYAVGLKSEKFYGRAKERKPFNFMKHRILYFCISLAVIIAGIVGMVAYNANGKGILNYSLEFVGGTSTTADFGQEYTIEEIEGTIVPEVADVIGDNAIQATAVSGTTRITLKTRTLDLDERQAVNSMLVEKFGVDESTIESQSISSTISSEMRTSAIWAVVVACVFMLLYIWFRFKDIRFATSAIAALVHDVLIVLAAYALVRISVGNTFIACMLTIVGYSVNDTIVIFDRIRENLHGVAKHTKEELAEVANKSLTQTLARSINTSITTIIMVLMLIILGVSSIREFAIPLLVGLICGSYSSIFIATELWYEMKMHLGKDRICKK